MWSPSTYSLICYASPNAPVFRTPTGTGVFPKSRLFEYTSPALKRDYANDLPSLAELPALVVAECRPEGDSRTPAFLARIEQVRAVGNEVWFTFRRIQSGRFTSEGVFGSGALGLDTGNWEHSRVHWAVKEGDLLGGLFGLLADRESSERPRLFDPEDWPLPPLDHVAVMMPFNSSYDGVYRAIRRACEAHNLVPKRVDEIYRPNIIMRDVFSTIVQSRFVISDLTGKNPNVLYETGIAHARNCEVVILVQNEQDVPFDLRHIRFVQYLPNEEGYRKLQKDLEKSIGAILESP